MRDENVSSVGEFHGLIVQGEEIFLRLASNAHPAVDS